jgi:hypothetical protein
MNCSVGQDVPETSDVTVIGVVVTTPVRGSICSGVIVKAALGAAAACTVDGAVTTPRSDPHATSDNAASVAAPNPTIVLALLTMPLLAKAPAIRDRREARVHEACHSSALSTSDSEVAYGQSDTEIYGRITNMTLAATMVLQ